MSCTKQFKNTFIPLPVNLTVQCKQVLSDIGLMKLSEINHHGYKAEPVFYHDFFNPKRHVPPTNPTNDCNISPVIGNFLALLNQCKMHRY